MGETHIVGAHCNAPHQRRTRDLGWITWHLGALQCAPTSGVVRALQVLAACFFALFVSGCARPVQKARVFSEARPIRVVATTGMVADIVREIGGERLQVTQLMGAGVDPHLYKAGVRDTTTLGDADIVFYSGLHLEGKMTEIMEKLGRRLPTVPVAEHIPRAKLHFPSDFEGSPDPHVWFDVRLWMNATQTARDALVRFDPTHATEYENRARKYLQRLQTLDNYARTQLATVPKAQRVLITAHDAFGYFGAAYDVEVRGLQGISTASEYGLNDVSALVNLLVSRKIKAVFVESSVSSRAIEAVVQGCRAQGHEVKIGGTLFSDAMGKAGTFEGTYIGMVTHNVDTIVAALK